MKYSRVSVTQKNNLRNQCRACATAWCAAIALGIALMCDRRIVNDQSPEETQSGMDIGRQNGQDYEAGGIKYGTNANNKLGQRLLE